MAGEWITAKIGDCFDLVSGYAFKSGEFIESGIPVIKIKNVKANQMLFNDLSYVAPDFLKTRAEKIVKKGDLLITMSGNRFDGSPDTWVGKVAQFNENRPFMLNQRVGILRPKKGVEVDRRFFAFSLSSHFYQTQFIAIATSSGGQANLSPSQILGAPIEYPPLPIQRRIAHILGTLDDKIELNRRMNATLEAMARAIFKSWFVDFDPVHENMRRRQSGTQQHPANPFEPTAQAVGLDHHLGGNPPTGVGGSKTRGSNTGGRQFAKTNDGPYPNDEPTAQAVGLDSTSRIGGGFGMNPPTGVGGSSFGFSVPPDIAALFPDSFEDSELGSIPKGWRIQSLADLMEIQGGTQPPASEFISELKPGYIRLVQIRDYESDSHLTFVRDNSKLRKTSREDVMIARYGASVARICWGLEGAYNVALVKAAPLNLSCREYLRSYLQTGDFQARLIGMSNRSVQAGFNKGDIASFRLTLPANELLQKYQRIAWNLRHLILQRKDESRALASLRDTLLPKLLSGELRVPEAEKIVERTV